MRDSLRALSNEIVARDQNSVVSPISFMRDYSRLHSPPLCPHSHTETHSVYPSFSLYQLKESLSHTQNAKLSLEAMNPNMTPGGETLNH